MSQLTLYDFLSFFLPGFMAAEVLRVATQGMLQIVHVPDAEQMLLLLAPSLLLGIFIHWLSALLGCKWRWYGRLLKPSVKYIAAKEADISYITGSLNEYCTAAIGVPFAGAEGNFFDYAYYYLEAGGKIGPAKGYQSLYFFCANCACLGLILLVAMVVLLAGHWMPGNTVNLLRALSLLPVLAVSVIAGRFCRAKMTVRIFRTYHILKKEPTLK